MKIILGLGNPGPRYKNNRHNIGYLILEELAGKRRIKFARSIKLSAYLAEDNLNNEKILLVKPRTFMNNSGICLKKIIKKYKTDIKDVLVVYDDVDLKLGNIRFSQRGSCAGHRGMASVLSVVDTNSINRLRVGIGKPASKDLSDYVLSDFDLSEKSLLNSIIEKSVLACKDWAREGTESVMSKYNRRGG
ncbi:MAG: aminoacyl-tRNA hydrolase [Candidatus Omnitrophica bacterium]|nr:aminoacyl-tRNA hydrolase [Candidatus Omnitrophota bacterium]